MRFDPEQGEVDWDGLLTFLLTLLLLLLTLGIPLLILFRSVSRTADAVPDITSARRLLVFGKRLLRGQIDDDYRQRLDKAAALMQELPERRLLLLGGAGKDGELSEAAAGMAYLLSLGVPEARLMREEQSQNTLENLRHARALIQGDAHEPVALISNRYHLARIHTMAESLGIDHQLCGCETGFRISLKILPRLLIEAWYILWFKTGKSWARLIGSQRMLDRVT
jgi:uncharacterized SAM-binding protein YcdF (DUF218 family)